ncbi:MAG TPA: NUDIX domain-containing protein [Patescibacteria group bacterium]|nr:NUDIX domain-containing protein [Patescibacteria group bacterium]
MKLEKSSGGVVINNGRVILVSQRRTGTWSFPKGHWVSGETSEETARREIHEESGVRKLQFIKDLGTYQRGTTYRPDILKEISLLQFQTDEEILEPEDKENPEAIWVPLAEVESRLSYEEDKAFWQKIKKKL